MRDLLLAFLLAQTLFFLDMIGKQKLKDVQSQESFPDQMIGTWTLINRDHRLLRFIKKSAGYSADWWGETEFLANGKVTVRFHKIDAQGRRNSFAPTTTWGYDKQTRIIQFGSKLPLREKRYILRELTDSTLVFTLVE